MEVDWALYADILARGTDVEVTAANAKLKRIGALTEIKKGNWEILTSPERSYNPTRGNKTLYFTCARDADDFARNVLCVAENGAYDLRQHT